MRWSRDSAPSLFLAFIIGVCFGWLVIGWWLWPVVWTGAWPSDLLPTYRDTYVVGIAYALQATADGGRAQQSMEALGTSAQQREALDAAIASYPASGDALAALGQALRVPPPSLVTEKEGAWIVPLFISMLVVFVIGLGLFALWRRGFWQPGRLSFGWLRLPAISAPAWASRLGSRPQQPVTPNTTIIPNGMRPASEAGPNPPRVKPAGGRKLGSFTPSYQRGMPEYTDSFNLTMSDGAGYAGHCGMGISESLNGDDSNVTALEVWLFDKSDIRTQTYVLASEHAHNDPDLHNRLKLRGNLILTRPGEAFTIESKSLVLEGKVVAVTYADDVEPENGVFQEVKVNLEVHLR